MVVHVLAFITAQPGQRAPLLQSFQANVPPVHAEDGCIEYVATVDAPGASSVGPDGFVVVEKWASQAALQAHSVAPHMKAFSAQNKDLIASVVLHVLDPAPGA